MTKRVKRTELEKRLVKMNQAKVRWEWTFHIVMEEVKAQREFLEFRLKEAQGLAARMVMGTGREKDKEQARAWWKELKERTKGTTNQSPDWKETHKAFQPNRENAPLKCSACTKYDKCKPFFEDARFQQCFQKYGKQCFQRYGNPK